jgi:YesN/AraC family two-component response regulator
LQTITRSFEKGWRRFLKTQKDIKVVAEATNGEEALELSNPHSPDVLLLDSADAKEGWASSHH